MRGVPHSVTGSEHLLASNGLFHEEILGIFGETFHGDFRHEMPAIG